MNLEGPSARRSVTLETVRLMELIEHSKQLLREREGRGASQDESSFLSLQMAHDRAVTGVLRLSAQASEIAASHAALFDAKEELEQALQRLRRSHEK